MLNSYSQEDVQQILHLAIARQTDQGELTRTQLLEISEELGIAPQDLQIAEQEWLARRGEDQARQAFNLYRHRKLKGQVVRYVIVNTFLVLLNLLTSGGLSWSLYVVLGWGAGLALSSWRLLQTDGEDYENAFQRWQRHHWLKKSVYAFWERWIRATVEYL
jgi:hypothetical protein